MNAVLCCTYNGEKYLLEQLNSILDQLIIPNYIFIFDFNSTDDTLNIIKKFDFGSKTEKIIRHLHFTPGPSQSFFTIIDFVYNYYPQINNYFLCDQDDVWKPNKISSFLKYPLPPDCSHYLITSNVSLIDSHGNIINQNRLKESIYYKDNFDYIGSASILANPFPGMSMMISRATAKKYLQYQNKNMMHDWNIFIITIFSNGKLFFINESLVLYRQHSSNYIGSSSHSTFTKRLFLLNSHYRTIHRQFDYFKSIFNIKYKFISINFMKQLLLCSYLSKISKLYFLILIILGLFISKKSCSIHYN